MQPADALVPTILGRLVPCMRKEVKDNRMALVPRGLFGPAG